MRAVPKAAEAATRDDGAPGEELPWAQFSAGTFARAQAEQKYVVMDGSAAWCHWCHWCHVMEATTYHDPAIRKLLDAHLRADSSRRKTPI